MRPHVRFVVLGLAGVWMAVGGRAQDTGGTPVPPVAAEQGAPPAAPGVGEPLPPLVNRYGETLRRPRILAFDGETFQVEHADGVAAVPWDAMPEAWRRGFRRDSARAAAARQTRAQRRKDDAQRRATEQAEAEPAPPPVPEPPPKAVVIERKIRLGDLYLLPTIGGPEGELRIWRVSQTEVTFERRRYASQTVEKKLGFNSPRTLLFNDGRGCSVWFVDRPRTIEDRYLVTVQFEYEPGRAPPDVEL